MKIFRKSSPRVVARNAVYNLMGEGWAFLVLLVAMPRIVKLMGEDGFGLFSLAWIAISYLLFLDIGVSRATTKFVSEHLAKSELEETRAIVGTATLANLALGGLGGLCVIAVLPVASQLFRIPVHLQGQTELVVYGVAAAVPCLLLQGVFRAVLSSMQAFFAMNLINAGAITLQWGAAWFLAWRGFGIGFIVIAVVITRFISTLLYGVVLLKIAPGLVLRSRFEFSAFKKLIKFGGWVTMSQVVSPLLVYLDRAMIAAFVSLAAVTVYTIPTEITTRLRIIPSSIVSTLYPAFSERNGEGDTGLSKYYYSSTKYLLLILLPMFSLLVLLGPDMLAMWMGRDLATKGAVVLQILVAGAFLNCMAYVPYSLLQAVGRPDLTGKFHLLEVPFYVARCFLLIPKFGIIGAAIAGTARYAIDALLLFGAVNRVKAVQTISDRKRLNVIVLGAVTVVGILAISTFMTTLWTRCVGGTLFLLVYTLTGWHFCLAEEDRPMFSRFFGQAKQSL